MGSTVSPDAAPPIARKYHFAAGHNAVPHLGERGCRAAPPVGCPSAPARRPRPALQVAPPAFRSRNESRAGISPFGAGLGVHHPHGVYHSQGQTGVLSNRALGYRRSTARSTGTRRPPPCHPQSSCGTRGRPSVCAERKTHPHMEEECAIKYRNQEYTLVNHRWHRRRRVHTRSTAEPTPGRRGCRTRRPHTTRPGW